MYILVFVLHMQSEMVATVCLNQYSSQSVSNHRVHVKSTRVTVLVTLGEKKGLSLAVRAVLKMCE